MNLYIKKKAKKKKACNSLASMNTNDLQIEVFYRDT